MSGRCTWLAVLPAICACSGAPASAASPAPAAAAAQSASTFVPSAPWLRTVEARLRTAGVDSGGQLALEAASTGDRVGRVYAAPPDLCVLVVARASPSVADLDVHVYGDDGAVLGADEAPDDEPSVLICPPRPERLFVAARVAAGYGMVALAAYPVPEARARAVARALNLRDEATGDIQSGWPGLDALVHAHREELGGEWLEVRRTAIPLEPRVGTRMSTAVDANACLDIIVLPAPEVAHLEVVVETMDGRTVGRASPSGRSRTLLVCSSEQTPLTIVARPEDGRGLGAVVLSKSEPGKNPSVPDDTVKLYASPVLSLDETREQIANQLEDSGYQPARLVGSGTLASDHRRSTPIQLGGGCTRVDVLVAPPASGVEAWLWSQQGALLAHGRGGASTALYGCGPPGSARLDLATLGQPGPYAIEARAAPGVPSVLTSHPLASSRLIDQLWVRGVLKDVRHIGAPRAVTLSPTQLTRVNILVPVRRCVEVALALGPGATGAEIRLLDGADGSELELARGTFATSARACALKQPTTLQAVAELRSAAGSTTALFATRMLHSVP